MKLIRDLSVLPDRLRRGAVAIGNFDGVHLGHARIVERLLQRAAEADGPAVIFTFEPHPVRLLRPEEAPPPLTWTERKAELLADLGVDAIIAYQTDESLLRLSAREFFDRIVRDALDAKAIVEGPNFFFGRGREGNIDVLRRFCDSSGLKLDVVEPILVEGEYVSSSRVRSLIANGRVDDARKLLTRPYRIRGLVTHGAGRGAKIGFPTANMGAVDTLLPRAGVYAGRGFTTDRSWPAAINLGPNPTFGEQGLKLEVHLIGFSGSLYGQPLEVDFLAHLRDIQRFAGPESLVQQVHQDVRRAGELASSTP